MCLDLANVVERLYAAYARQDLEAIAAGVSEDFVFALHVDREVAPFAGVSIGKGAFIARLGGILQIFDPLVYEVERCVAGGDEVRGRVYFHYRHRNSGSEIAGTMRHVFWMRDGVAARLNEYHDRARLEAFLRLASQHS